MGEIGLADHAAQGARIARERDLPRLARAPLRDAQQEAESRRIALHQRPRSLQRLGRDARKLAVAFDRIAINDADGPAVDAPGLPALAVRLAAVPPLDEGTTWHSTESRFTPARLDRASVEKLLGRLGLDPATTWPRLVRGDVRLEDLIETAAYGMDCLDDETFVRQTFTLLMGRSPGEAEVRSLMDVERARVVGRIGKFEEFRERVGDR